MTEPTEPAEPAAAARIVARLTERVETIACAESLTAGLVCATLADTPGASMVRRGGVVAYAADVKVASLDVPGELVERVGTVDAEIAQAMAEGVRRRLGATWGLSTTGVAGPGPAEGKTAGTVYVGVAGPAGTAVRDLRLTGTRTQIRRATVEAVFDLAEREMTTPVDCEPPRRAAGGTVGTAPTRSERDPNRRRTV